MGGFPAGLLFQTTLVSEQLKLKHKKKMEHVVYIFSCWPMLNKTELQY